MRTKVTLVLVFLNVALFFFIFKFERNWRTEAASLEARRRVLGSEAADIRWLEVTNTAANTTFSLTRERGQWQLNRPLNWPANPYAAESMVNALQLLEHETSFLTRELGRNGNPTLADYGLDQPKLTVAFRSGEPGGSAPSTLLRIGDITKGNRLYVLSPDGERVHVVNRSLADTLSLPLEKLRADAVFTIGAFEARSLNIQSGNPDQARSATATAPLRIRLRGDNTRWVFDAPISARASKLAVDTTIGELNALRAENFSPPPPATLPSVASTLRITLEGNNRHETLYLGEPVRPAPTPPPAAGAAAPAASPAAPSGPAREYYAQLEGRDAIFTVVVKDSLLETLRNAQGPLRERRLLDFDPRAVTAIVLGSPLTGQPALTLQRLEGAPGAAEGAWQVRRGEGAQGPQTQAADAELIQRLLAQLASLTALRFESDAFTTAELENWGLIRPAREVTLSFSGGAAGSTAATQPVFQFGTSSSQNVFARVSTAEDAGKSVYAVAPEILRDLRLEPIAWRHRLVHELPATARISALKLTDLGNNQVLLDAAFDPAGQPAGNVRAPEALKALAAQLRRLQARRFVHDTFAERAAVGGNEVAWRFRLDATVTLPAVGAEQASTLTLFFTERGPQQYAGSKEIDAIFEIEQPLIDALWPLSEGARDPGPPPAPTKQ